MKRTLFVGLAIAAVLLPSIYAQDIPLEPGSFSIGGRLNLDFYSHRLGDGWTATKTGYKGINYNFARSTSASSSQESSSGQTLFLDVAFRPIENLNGKVTFEYINNYADRFWMPVNYEHRRTLDGDKFSFNKADIVYSPGPWSLRYARNMLRMGWSDKGDIFELFPDQTEPDKYLRISGEPAPEWWQFNAYLGRAGKLELVYGNQAIWDYRNGIYANYNFHLLGASNYFIYRDHVIPYGDEGERMRAYELSSVFDVGRNTFEAGLMYQPFRLGRDYTYVDEVAPGTGDLGTKYLKKTGRTSSSDAMGASAKVTVRPYPVLNELILQYTHRGLSAGNKREFETQMTKRVSSVVSGTLGYIARQPLIGPLPMIFEGTAGNTGPAFLQPRGPESPFWVGWRNKVAGWDNREANIVTFTLNVDPTPDTWFYLHRPNVLEDWNINPNENAPVSFAAAYKMENYPKGTDRLLFWDANGNVVWENPMLTTPWPTDGYIGSFLLMSRINYKKWKFLVDAGAGQDLAWGSFAYVPSEAKKPITNFFTMGVSAEKGPYAMRLRYGQDVFGPEDWYKQFGEVYGRLYQASVSRKIGQDILLGVDYVGARAPDSKYVMPDVGEFDEFHAYLSLSFGPLVPYFGDKPQAARSYGESPDFDFAPPAVSVMISTTTLSPESGDLTIQPWASDLSGIAKWKISITDSEGREVKTISGDGPPPYTVKWNGRDDLYDMTVKDGDYQLSLTAEDEVGNAATTDPVSFKVVNPPQKAAAPREPKQLDSAETSRGLKITLSADALFGDGSDKLKPGAAGQLDDLVNLLDQYTLNKIAVEGYTDSQGSKAYNRSISERRAWSVAQYLIKAGVKPERIKVTGYGKDKPVASNLSESGRKKNRRVEVIILK